MRSYGSDQTASDGSRPDVYPVEVLPDLTRTAFPAGGESTFQRQAALSRKSCGRAESLGTGAAALHFRRPKRLERDFPEAMPKGARA